MADDALNSLLNALAEVLRKLPESPATGEVRDRVIDVIRHLESKQLIPQANWNLGSPGKTAGK